MLDQLPVGVCLIHQGTVTYANTLFAHARGTTPEALLGRAWHDLMHDGDRSTLQRAVDARTTDGTVLHAMYDAPHPLLGSRRMYGSYQSIGSETLLLAEADLDDLDQAQHRHDTFSAYQRLAINNSNDGIWVWNVIEDSVIFLGNFLPSLGYGPTDIQSNASWALSLIHPEDVTATPTDFEPYRTGELKEWRTESRFRTKDGSWVWALVRGRVIQWSEDGQPVVMIGSHVNIDDLKRAELSLVHRNEVLNTISIANNHFVLGNDPMLAFDEILGALLRATHAPRGMLAGVRYYNDVRHFVIHATNNNSPQLEDYKRKWSVLPPAFVVSLESEQLDPVPLGCAEAMRYFLGSSCDGSTARILAVRSGTSIVGFVVLGFDPDQPMCLDQALLEPLMATYASLIIGYRAKIEEARVRDELARRSEELERANAELEHANAMKDSFLANMSHELRSPLSTVIGVTEALIDGIYGDVTLPQRECINDASEAARHLLSLINDLLDLSRARLGEIDLFMEEFHIEDLLRSTMSIMRELAHRKGINLEFTMPKERVVLLGDVRRIKQVFVNLLSNAIKFTPQGGYVSVIVAPDRASNIVRIHVEDDGIGIPETHLRHVFEPFTQIDSRLSRQHEGTGLGLPIVQRIVDLHGGIVEVRSTVGKGSTFTVILPWEDMQRDVSMSIAATPVEPATQPSRIHRGLIYVVDDNAMNRRLLRDFAQLEGYTVREFGGGLECLDALIVNESPDAIVMDIQMPGMDGLETIRRIRSAEAADQHIPIIALTALVMPGDRELCLAAGADLYVTKPVEYREFIREIEILLSRMTSPTPPPQAEPSDS